MSDISGLGMTGAEEGSIVGRNAQMMSTARTNLDVDVKPVDKLSASFDKLRDRIKKVREELNEMSKAANSAAGAVQGATGGKSTIGQTSAGTPMAGALNNSSLPVSLPGIGGGAGAGAAGGGGGLGGIRGAIGAAGGAAGIASVAGAAVAQGMATIDARVDRGRDYALSADRMSVMYQQMYGMSQQQVQQQFRRPLTQYRLGAGGINELLGLQATTGISAAQQASSLEAIRTISGYSISAQQGTQIISSLADPATVNRMGMMGVGGLIGPGGQQRSTQDVIQNIVRSAGLTDPNILRGAFAPGSITRSRLSMMGVAPELQDIVLQYAQSNIEFGRAGGRGMYDPSRKEDRKLMGIEDNFATQAEETDRLRVARDEQFYARQADNYADLEQQTQKLIKVFGELEDKLSGIIGARTSNRIGMKVAGGLLMGAGIALAPFTGGSSALAAAAAASTITGAGLLGGPTGDPMAGDTGSSERAVRNTDGQRRHDARNDANIRVPTHNGPRSLNEVKNMSSFKNMHPKMQDRILQMMRENPAVGFGEGVRSQENQKTLFLSRYKRTNKETKIFWDGSYWEHVSGPPAAPPGRSMHGIGLAADLMGDLDWVVANAQRFGLQHFKEVNGEPWHVQPAELPAGFGDYIKSGATWGRGPNGEGAGSTPVITNEEQRSSNNSLTGNSALSEHSGDREHGVAPIAGYSSISDRVSGPLRLAGGGGGTGAFGRSARVRTPVQTSRASGAPKSGEDIARLLYGAGFRGQDLVKMVAISKRESHWNPNVLNPDASTGDLSYGLFQINMIGDLGPWRMNLFRQNGLVIDSAEDLYDPETNVRAAKIIYDFDKKANNDGLHAWGGYKGMDPTYKTNMEEAARIIASLGYSTGDPMPETLRNVGGASSRVSVSGGNTFNISPTIQVMGGSTNGMDLNAIARTVALLVKRELEMNNMRTN